MSTTFDHPLSALFADVALGAYPVPDGSIDVLGPLDGPCDSLTVFAGHVVIAADVSEEWVRQHTPERWDPDVADLSNAITRLVFDLAEKLGGSVAAPSTLCVASHQASIVHGDLTEGGHPNRDWAAYRTDIKSYQYTSIGGNGTISIGTGPAGRCDLYHEVDHRTTKASGRTSQELLRTAKTLVPPGSAVFGSAQLHDIRVLRSVIAARFEPVALEILFRTR